MDAGERDRWFRLGCGLHSEKRWGAAAACFARCLGSGDSGFEGRVLVNLGWNLHLVGREGEGEDRLVEALACLSDEGAPHALLAQVLLTERWDGVALRHAERAVGLSPELPVGHMSLAFAAGICGDWARCWSEYEWRFRYRADLYGAREVPLWRGEVVERLWVEAEMGLGDTIFGLRWLPAAVDRLGGGERVVLHVQPELLGWVRGVFAGVSGLEVLPTPRQPPDGVEAWCPVMSLPVALGEPGPLGPNLGFEARNLGSRVRVGICWAGNPAHEQAHHRDCPLPYWVRLAENPGIELHSLQVGGTQALADLGLVWLVRDRAPEITNFADTAAILGELDLLITVDTAVAHLAGALGVPVWLLVNQRGQDFRWGRGEGTGWYPSMRLFRRSLDEDWGAVLARIDKELRKL